MHTVQSDDVILVLLKLVTFWQRILPVRRITGRSYILVYRATCCWWYAYGILCASARKGKLCVFSKSGICVFEKTLHVFGKTLHVFEKTLHVLAVFGKTLHVFQVYIRLRQPNWLTDGACATAESWERGSDYTEALAAYVAYSNSHRSCCHIVCYLLASCILSRAGQRKNICSACRMIIVAHNAQWHAVLTRATTGPHPLPLCTRKGCWSYLWFGVQIWPYQSKSWIH